ncbi:MAG: alpha/beta fold hydrolase [Desulfomonilaceae bacterium]
MLSLFFVLALLVGGIICFAYFLSWYYSSSSNQDATYLTVTEDGWRIAIHRYKPENIEDPVPVILCHGLGSNRFVFDLEEAPSLACYLKDAGYDVWLPELRGSGMSDAPGLFSSRSSHTWGFDDHLKFDLPRIIDFVTQQTGSKKIRWIGHSMGGMLVNAYISVTSDPRISSVITIGAPVDFSQMNNHIFKRLLKLKCVLKLIPINPLPFFGRLLVPVITRTPNFVHGLYYRLNIDPHIARKISSIGCQLISSSKLWLDMGQFLETGRFGPCEGGNYLDRLRECNVPLLVIAGSKDFMATLETVVPAAVARDESFVRKLVVAGKDSGFAENYGHIDLLIGLRSREEIFPIIRQWLEKF